MNRRINLADLREEWEAAAPDVDARDEVLALISVLEAARGYHLEYETSDRLDHALARFDFGDENSHSTPGRESG